MTEDFAEVGVITGAHGITGEVRLRPYTQSDVFFQKGQTLVLQKAGHLREYDILGTRPHKSLILLRLEGVPDRNAAEALVKSVAVVQKSRFPEPEEDEWYYFDLLGLDVQDVDGNYLGRLRHIIETGANDVFEVWDEKKRKETLVPALDWVIISVDLEDNLMVVDLPEGL